MTTPIIDITRDVQQMYAEADAEERAAAEADRIAAAVVAGRNVHENNRAAKAGLFEANKRIAEIDAQLGELVDLLVADKITPTLAKVREIDLLKRRAVRERQANAMLACIKDF